MRFQLWLVDEYGQQSTKSPITTDVNKIFENAFSILNDENVNNALTLIEKQKNWEYFMPVFISEDETDERGEAMISRNMIYGGRAPGGRQIVYVLNESGSEYDAVDFSEVEPQYKLLLGKLDQKNWFAGDERGEEIHNIKHRLTEAKSVLFVKMIP